MKYIKIKEIFDGLLSNNNLFIKTYLSLMVICSTLLVVSGCGGGSPSQTSPPTQPPIVVQPTNTLSPIAMFAASDVFADFRGGTYSAKKSRSYNSAQDMTIAGVFIPANSNVTISNYYESCQLAMDCLNLAQLTTAEAAEIKAAVVDSNTQISRLDPSDYIYKKNTAVRNIWRWSKLLDTFPHTAAEVQAMSSAGIKLIPTIVQDRVEYRHTSYPMVGKGCVTKDLTDTFDPSFGYSQLYFNWVTSLLNHYGDVIKILIIENEVDQHNNTWCEATRMSGNTDPLAGRNGYAKMVITAKYAAQKLNSKTLIADSGMMGNSWIRLALIHYISQRRAQNTPTDIIDTQLERYIVELISQIQTAIPQIGGVVDWNSIYAAADMLAQNPNNNMINALDIINLLNSSVLDPNLGGVTPLDVYNHHNHSSSSSIAPVVQYIRAVYAKNPDDMVINHEMGILTDKTNKTLAANNSSLLNVSEFMPVTPFLPVGENEVLGGVDVGGTLVPLQPRVEQIATTDLVKKFVHSMGNGVSLITYYGFNGAGGINVTYAQVNDGSPYHFYQATTSNLSSTLTEDHLLIAQNFRAILNLRALFNSAVISSSYARGGRTESYLFDLTDKTVSSLWVQAYTTNLDLNNQVVPEQVDISTEINAGCSLYDVEGFNLPNPGNNLLSVGLKPVFIECMK